MLKVSVILVFLVGTVLSTGGYGGGIPFYTFFTVHPRKSHLEKKWS